MPGIVFTIWWASPYDMKPAPIKATRTGRPSLSRAFSALSTIIMRTSEKGLSLWPALRAHAHWYHLLQTHLLLELRFLFVQSCPGLVPFRHNGYRKSPLQRQPRIVIQQSAFGPRRVELSHLIARFGIVSQHLVPVCKALRHVEGAAVVLGQFDSDVVQVGRAFWTQVHDDIQDSATSAAHEFCLRRRWKLEMHAAQRALLVVEGDIDLGNAWIQAICFELILTEGAREEASRVLAPLDIDHKCALQLCLREDHADGSPFLTALWIAERIIPQRGQCTSGVEARDKVHFRQIINVLTNFPILGYIKEPKG